MRRDTRRRPSAALRTAGRTSTAWARRDLAAKRYVYVWAGGIHLEARLEDEKQCILVLIGATSEGRKELVGFTDGARESEVD
jgi:transposase-like protein